VDVAYLGVLFRGCLTTCFFVDIQTNEKVLQNQVEAMEVELAEKKLLLTEHHELLDSDDELEGGSRWRGAD